MKIFIFAVNFILYRVINLILLIILYLLLYICHFLENFIFLYLGKWLFFDSIRSETKENPSQSKLQRATSIYGIPNDRVVIFWLHIRHSSFYCILLPLIKINTPWF